MPMIHDVEEFDQALENGPYAWPGGYPLYFVMADGESLSFNAAKENADLIRASIADDINDNWRVVCVLVNWEDADLYCAHSNEKIQSAYGDDDEQNEQILLAP